MAVTSLGQFLDPLYDRYHHTEFLSSDPLEFAHRYADPWDQEAVALLGAVLAYGNVKQIRKSVQEVLTRIHSVSPGPAVFVREISSHQKSLNSFIHRFNVGRDLALLFRLLGQSWEKYGSLGAHFLSHLEPEAPTIEAALSQLISDWRQWAGRAAVQTSFNYLLTSPEDGSCCKRWCMFLRWMGRKDRLDLGLWQQGSKLAHTFPNGRELKPSQLVIPLDTHTGRISQYLELTRRKSLNWRAAVEVTDSLRRCQPLDPTRYDFALSRLGILDLCQRKFRENICLKCDLLRVCRYAKRRTRHLAKPSVL